jgi:phage regulator Rha-like protein
MRTIWLITRMVQELLHIHNQGSELRADSREVAKLFGVEHESLRKNIEVHTPELEQLGHLRFEIGHGVKRPQGGGPQEKFCYLNFDHLAFLLTVSKPSEATKDSD